jgi:hypothetical protein
MLKYLNALPALCLTASTMAAGPLVLEGANGHVPATYADPNIVLDIETGDLGSLPNEFADQLVSNAVTLWNNVPDSKIFLDPNGTGVNVDIDETNFTSYIPNPYNNLIHNDDDGRNPIVYDDDGSIIDAFFGIGQGTGGEATVVGFAASSIIIGSSFFTEGFAVINGNSSLNISNAQLTLIIAHEIGHFFGLDHSQGNIDNRESLETTSCFTAQAREYPLMYPWACRETLDTHPDDDVSLSMLYPETDFFQRQGQLIGKFITTDGDAVKGANLWLQNTATGEVYSIVSDYLKQCTGFFALMLPPGNYTLHANSINDEFWGGSSVGPYAFNSFDLSFQPPASTIGSVDFDAGGTPPAILNLEAGKSVDVVFRTDGSGSVTMNETQVDLVQIYNSTEACAVTSATSSSSGSGSPSPLLLLALLSIPALRAYAKRQKFLDS